jgi:hypothetical protein
MVAMDDDVTAAARPGYDVDRDGADSELAGLDDEADLARRLGWAKVAILGAALTFLNAGDSDVRELAARIARNQAKEINEYRIIAERLGYDIEIERATVPAEIVGD